MRLKNRDYSLTDLYFVTICAGQRRCILSRINRQQVELTQLGHIARESWITIPLHFPRFNLHSFVIMPNHMHAIIEIAGTGLAQHAAPLRGKEHGGFHGVQAGSLSAIVRSFKAEVSRRGRDELSWDGRIWQPNYFDRVKRGGREFSDASRYIQENPLKWKWDLENPRVAEARPEKATLAQHAARLQGTPSIDEA